jgi:L-asparaginase II
MYATIAAAADESEKTPNESTRTQALSRIYHAMSNHPDLVGGEGRFCTALIRAFHGALIGKVGAQACYGVGIRASERTKQLGADGAMGISVKIEDGNLAMAFSAVAEILEQLDIGTQEMRKELDPFHHPDVVNTVGVVTGHTSHSFRLR